MVGSPAEILFPPMLFPRNALASGPQACSLAEKNKSEGGQAMLSLPAPGFCSLGFTLEEFGSSSSAGSSFSNHLPAFPPQREAGE
jgi:hypothetical protein